MQVLVGLVALAAMVVGAYAMLAQGGGPQAAVIVILTGLVGYLVYRSQKAIDHAGALETQLAGDKRRTYQAFVDLWRSISTNPAAELSESQQTALGDFLYGTLLLSSDEVVRAVGVITRLDRLGDQRMRVPAFADLLLALRKDVGYPRTSLTSAELAAVIVNDVEDHLDSFAAWLPVREGWRRRIGGKR